MAQRPEKPSGEFLGGSLKFNTVGGPVPQASSDPAADDTGPILVPTRLNAQSVRTLVIMLIILALAAVLYFVNDNGLGGLAHTAGRAGVSPADKPSVPPKNF